jgi:hypothetical protein
MIPFGGYNEKRILSLPIDTWLMFKRKSDGTLRWVLIIKSKPLGREIFVQGVKILGADAFKTEEKYMQVSEMNFRDFDVFTLEPKEIEEYSKLIFAGTL